MKRFISDQVFRFFNVVVSLIPCGLLGRMLRVLYFQPELAARVGYHVFPEVFYNPFPNPAEVDVAKLKLKRSLPGIELDLQKSKTLLGQLAAYSKEVNEFMNSRPAEMNLPRWDITFPRTDAAALYTMLRLHKPKRYIEVGCGYSSRSSSAAIRKNIAEGHPCTALYIEPFPPSYLPELPGEFLKQRVEQVPLERFQQLEAGDVLFIDTSHVIKVQNDVEYELVHILPSLKPGVIVHIHDIFTPYDYPQEWLVGEGTNRGGNNEQYALECLLSGGGDWEVILPVHLLWREHRDWVKQVIDADDRPAAFWIQKLKRTVTN